MEFNYSPTPLEEAYGHYLIDTVFPPSSSSWSNVQDCAASDDRSATTTTTRILRITGRHAVPFLSQSGLDRDVLRNMWSLVDPAASGYLSTVHQWMTLLRLVSMAQQQQEQQQVDDDDDDGGGICISITPSSNLYQCLMDTAHRTDLPLANFRGYPIPEEATLLQKWRSHEHQNGDTAMQDPFGFMEVTAATTSPNITSPIGHHVNLSSSDRSVVQLQQQQPPPYNNASRLVGTPNVSSSLVVLDHRVDVDMDDFGDFSTAISNTATTTHTTIIEPPQPPTTVTMGAWDALDALVTVVDAPLPTLPPIPIVVSNNLEQTIRDNHDDDFGTLTSVIDSMVTTPAIDITSYDDTDFGTFEGTTAATGPVVHDSSIIGVSVTSSQPENAEAFFGYNTLPNRAPHKEDASATDQPMDDVAALHHDTLTSQVDPWSAFDALSSVPQTALPTLQSVSDEPSMIVAKAEDSESEGFGDFIGTSNDEANVDDAVVVSTTDVGGDMVQDSFGEATDMKTPMDTAKSISQPICVENGWNALDELVVSNEIRLPAVQLTELSTLEGCFSRNEPIKPDESESEGFGDFVGTTNSFAEDFVTQPVDFAPGSQSNDAPMQCAQGDLPLQQNINNGGWSALDALAGNHDIVLTSFDELVSSQSPSCDGMLSMESPVATKTTEYILDTENKESDDPSMVPSIAVDSELADRSIEVTMNAIDDTNGRLQSPESGWDALDALNGVKDVPLPNLLHLSNEIAVCSVVESEESNLILTENVANSSNEDFGDGFGDFVGGTKIESPIENCTLVNSEVVEPSTASANLCEDRQIHKDAFDLLGPPEAVSMTKSNLFDRTDSSYFSAQAKSVSSDSQDCDNFEDAMMNGSEVDNDVDNVVQINSKNVTLDEGRDFFLNDVVSNGEHAFASFDSVAVARPSVEHSLEIADDAADDLMDDFEDFSDFHAAAVAEYGDAAVHTSVHQDVSIDSKNVMSSTGNVAATPAQASVLEEDDFGNFETVCQADPYDQNLTTFGEYGDAAVHTSAHNDISIDSRNVLPSIGNAAGTPAQANVFEEDDFGNFETVCQAAPHDQNPPNSEVVGKTGYQSSGFGDSGEYGNGAVQTSAHNDISIDSKNVIPSIWNAAASQAHASALEEDDFGNFETVNEADPHDLNPLNSEVVGKTEYQDSGFGDFGEFSPFEGIAGVDHLITEGEDFTTNRDFVAGMDIKSEDDWAWTRNQIVLKSGKLSNALRQMSGGVVDFGICLDVNIGKELPLSENRVRRILRCIKLMDRLSTGDANSLSTYWVLVLSIVKNELSNGLALLHDVSELSAEDKDFVRSKLQAYVYGLGECIRVARYISSTIADLLMVDLSTILSMDTLLSSWSSSTLASEAFQIEVIWDDLQQYAATLSISLLDSPSNKLDDLDKMRSSSFEAAADTEICNFTLQPFPNRVDENSTESVVTWSENSYLACAANLVANKSDFFSKQSTRLYI